jgi:hypothetical protein
MKPSAWQKAHTLNGNQFFSKLGLSQPVGLAPQNLPSAKLIGLWNVRINNDSTGRQD